MFIEGLSTNAIASSH